MIDDVSQGYADAGAAGSVASRREPVPGRHALAKGAEAVTNDPRPRPARPRHGLRGVLAAAQLGPENLAALKAAAIILAIIAFILLLHA
jgi:hypothetical protein